MGVAVAAGLAVGLLAGLWLAERERSGVLAAELKARQLSVAPVVEPEALQYVDDFAEMEERAKEYYPDAVNPFGALHGGHAAQADRLAKLEVAVQNVDAARVELAAMVAAIATESPARRLSELPAPSGGLRDLLLGAALLAHLYPLLKRVRSERKEDNEVAERGAAPDGAARSPERFEIFSNASCSPREAEETAELDAAGKEETDEAETEVSPGREDAPSEPDSSSDSGSEEYLTLPTLSEVASPASTLPLPSPLSAPPSVARMIPPPTGDLEQDVTAWIEAVSESSRGEQTFHEWLKDGVLLCELVNTIAPGLVPFVHRGPSPFKQRENISAFLDACRRFGVLEKELFTNVDLYDGKRLGDVATTVYHLAARARARNFGGPPLATGPPPPLEDLHS